MEIAYPSLHLNLNRNQLNKHPPKYLSVPKHLQPGLVLLANPHTYKPVMGSAMIKDAIQETEVTVLHANQDFMYLIEHVLLFPSKDALISLVANVSLAIKG